MTVRTPTYLKSVFENADIPQASDYEDVFDSFLPLSATAKQTLAFPVEFTGDVTASGDIWCKDLYVNKINAQRVSASGLSLNTIDVSQVSALVINSNQLNTNTVSASVINTNQINAQIVSASVGNFNVINSQVVSASVLSTKYFLYPVVASIAATGTTTAAATPVSAATNVIKSVTSAAQECVILKKARPGFIQTIINDTSVSAKVFPTSAAKFNNQSNGAPLDITNQKIVTIYHITSAQYQTATHTR